MTATNVDLPRKILLATDLSARCDRALDHAVSLAQAWQAQLFAVYALDQNEDFYATKLEQRLPSWRRQPDPTRLAEEQLRHDMLTAGQPVTVVVEKGEPADVILRTAASHGCDLIVTGIARNEALGRFGLGVTVDRLLRRSRIPLLIVTQRMRAPYRNVIVATDFSESSRYALQMANALFPGQQLGLFHAYEAPMAGMTGNAARYQEDYRKVVAGDYEAFLESSGLPAERRRRLQPLIEHGRPRQLIHQYVRDRGVDLVVLGTQGRSALLDLFIGSTAKDILDGLPCDALVVREPRAAAEATPL